MRVLYVSKASHVAAHRDKLAVLGQRVELTLLAPERWGANRFERSSDGNEPFATVTLRTELHGHNHFHFYRRLESVLRSGAFDLVHVDEEPYSLVTLQVATRARRAGVPSLFFAWQNLNKRLPPPFGTLRRRVFRLASGGIAGNREAAEVLRTNGYRGPVAVIPQMGVNPARFRPDPSDRERIRARLGARDGDFLIGYVGRLIPEKGVDLLLDAVAFLPAGRVVLIGDGPARGELERLSRARALAARVEFAGELPSLEVPGWLPALDCLVLPSRTTSHWKEQFGRVLIEAMACEVPVIGSDSGEIPSVIGNAGVVFPEGDARALTTALSALAESPDLRKRHGSAGRARALAHFTQDAVVSATVDFYRTISSNAIASKRHSELAARGA